MKNLKSLFILLIFSVIIVSCSKKVSPTQTNDTANNKNSDKISAEKVTIKPDSTTYVVKRKVIKTSIPQVITVNDVAAKKTVDGRLYYDLNGKRYWRNKRDGKFYLYNKRMYNDPDFKP